MNAAISNRLVAVTIIILVLISLLYGLQAVKVAEANPLARPASSTINIFSPTNTTYHTNSIILNFSVATDHGGNSVRYTLDGKSDGKVTNFTLVSVEPMPPREYFGKQYNWTQYTDMCNQALTDLSDGNHTLTVYSGYIDPYGIFYENGLATTNFIIDTSTTLPNFGPTSSPTPSIPEFPAIVAITLFMITILALPLVLSRKHSFLITKV